MRVLRSGTYLRAKPILSDTHPHQQRRIDTLESYDILDSGEEADFDDIVALASQICDAPISLISLVDDDRQWFKARVGFEPSETTLDKSICSHAILQDDLLVIGDLSNDARTADNPLHTEKGGVNFYAGANLIAPNGMPIGTLCVLDTKPRQLDEDQRRALRTLSRQVMTQLELRKRLREEEALRSEIDHRVKNSLQTISSIMRLASRQIVDEDALDVLQMVERRLDAVASLHTELMSRDGAGTVDARHYFQRVGALLGDVAPQRIKTSVVAQSGALNTRKASAIGMIVSEFMANSIKHAFPDDQNGEISVSLERHRKTGWILLCSDNGVGHQSGGAQSVSDTGLGEMLMKSASIQLGGQLEQDSGPSGTTLRIKFDA